MWNKCIFRCIWMIYRNILEPMPIGSLTSLSYWAIVCGISWWFPEADRRKIAIVGLIIFWFLTDRHDCMPYALLARVLLSDLLISGSLFLKVGDDWSYMKHLHEIWNEVLPVHPISSFFPSSILSSCRIQLWLATGVWLNKTEIMMGYTQQIL